MKAVLYSPEKQTPSIVTLSGTLEEFQKVVGGYIESLPLPYNCRVLFDEEGRIKRLPLNEAFSKVFNFQLMLVGPCLVVGTEGPNITDVDQRYIEAYVG